jgi:hypothetical protein
MLPATVILGKIAMLFNTVNTLKAVILTLFNLALLKVTSSQTPFYKTEYQGKINKNKSNGKHGHQRI